MLQSKPRKIHEQTLRGRLKQDMNDLLNSAIVNTLPVNQPGVKYSMQIGFVRIHLRVCIQSN